MEKHQWLQGVHRHASHAEAVARIGWCVSERALGVLDASRHTIIYLGSPAVGGRGLYAGIVSALGGTP
jgi:hypothetical protein